jgi:hypothetical protein
MSSNIHIMGRTYNLNIDFVNVKFVGHNFKISHALSIYKQ